MNYYAIDNNDLTKIWDNPIQNPIMDPNNPNKQWDEPNLDPPVDPNGSLPKTKAKEDPEDLRPATVSKPKKTSENGCWAYFSSFVGGIWATRQLSGKENREIYVRTTLRELMVYVIFLGLMCLITFGMTSHTMYYYTKVLSNLFLNKPYPSTEDKVTFKDSTEIPDLWNLRVKNDSCQVAPLFQPFFQDCYNYYSVDKEDREPFGPMKGTPWTYHTQEQLNLLTYMGKLATYSGGGYILDFAPSRNETEAMIAQLREKLWIDRGTRVLFIDFTIYNANINLFCVVKMLMEFPPSGSIIPSWTFKTVKLLRYVTPWDYFILACELLFVLFVIYYVVEEVLEAFKLKSMYLRNYWNYLDILVICLCFVCVGYNAYSVLSINSALSDLLKYPNEFANFESLGYIQTQYNSAVAVCVFFSWFKLFKYISFNKTMIQLSYTLKRSANDIGAFFVMFFIVFFAFCQLGYLLFGSLVDDYRSVVDSIFTLLRTILGDFDFPALVEAHRIIGPTFFMVYIFFVFLVLMNVFLAIINETYAAVKEELANQKSEFDIGDYFRRGYNNMLGGMGQRDKLIDIENALKLADVNKDGILTFEEVRKNLKKCNFSDMEVEMFFSSYDLDGNRSLNPDEVRRMLAELEGKKEALEEEEELKAPKPEDSLDALLQEEEPQPVTQEEMFVLTRRVDHMEHSLESISNKIDVILVKLDFMEKNKVKKDGMDKLMDDLDEIIEERSLKNEPQ